MVFLKSFFLTRFATRTKGSKVKTCTHVLYKQEYTVHLTSFVHTQDYAATSGGEDRVVMLEADFDPDLYNYSDFPFNFEITGMGSLPTADELREVIDNVTGSTPEGEASGAELISFHPTHFFPNSVL